jgi:hypothetical protein
MRQNYNFTILKHTLDANKPYTEAIQAFKKKLMLTNGQLVQGQGTALCVFYYSGHATQDNQYSKQLWLQ